MESSSSTSPFAPALKAMETSGEIIFGPKKFRDYLVENFSDNIPPIWFVTASWLSIQSLRGTGGLDASLREASVMVFRLGKGTFSLLKTENLNDYFLLDDELRTEIEEFSPICDPVELMPFKLLGSVESNAINLSLVSGLLQEALNLEPNSPRIAPTTGKSVFTFPVKPSKNLPHVEWLHDAGQVEIDALYYGIRNDRKTIFVIEGKTGKSNVDSLAKYKLAYPCLAIAQHPILVNQLNEFDIVPVYLRAWQRNDKLFFRITECSCEGLASNTLFINEVKPKVTRTLTLEIPSFDK